MLAFMNDVDRQKLLIAQRDKANAEIDALKALLEAEAKKTYAAIRGTAEKQLRVELLCTVITQLCSIAESGVDRVETPIRAQAIIDNAKELATELLK